MPVIGVAIGTEATIEMKPPAGYAVANHRVSAKSDVLVQRAKLLICFPYSSC